MPITIDRIARVINAALAIDSNAEHFYQSIHYAVTTAQTPQKALEQVALILGDYQVPKDALRIIEEERAYIKLNRKRIEQARRDTAKWRDKKKSRIAREEENSDPLADHEGMGVALTDQDPSPPNGDL